MSNGIGCIWSANLQRRPDMPLDNVSLVHHGLLSSSPLYPTWAVSLHTLEIFRRLRQQVPSSGIQSYVKLICDIHSIRYNTYLNQQFSAAFDTFLLIGRTIQSRVNALLRRTTPHWRLKHACPGCLYEVKGEHSLPFKCMLSVDGGNSAKRFANAGTADTRKFSNQTDYFIGRSEVDLYKTVVKTREPKAKKNSKKNVQETTEEVDEDDADAAIELGNEEQAPETSAQPEEEWVIKNVQADPTDSNSDGNDIITKCVERWKANADDSKKVMFNCFDESGIFVAVCRHGFLFTAADMVCSGEL